MEAIVLAGGLGTRLAGRLNGIPKAMAPVAGRPFLEILLSQLERAGCIRAVLSVGHLRASIQEHFGARFHGMRVDYAVEDTPLGTGGAIRRALPLAEGKSILVLNGDTLLDADYKDMLRFHSTERAPFTMAITRQKNIARYGGVMISGKRIVGYEEKGRQGAGWINAGAYVLDRDLEWPHTLGEKFSFEQDFLTAAVSRMTPAAYEVEGLFLDIGVPEDLDRAQTELAAFAP
jgi:D-glycero-alpha-D-manno-heptose 1-phosphate guanylyltransferase